MAILSKQKTIDTSNFLELNGTYQLESNDADVLTFKRNDSNYLTLGMNLLEIGSNNNNNQGSVPDNTLYVTATSINSFIEKDGVEAQGQPLQLQFGSNSQIYLRNYDANLNYTSGVNLTASGELIASNSLGESGSLNLLQGKLNNELIATESILLQVPIQSTVVNDGTITTLNLGSPTLLKGSGSINNYISVESNVVKIKSTTAKVIQFSGIFLGDFSSATGTDREFEFQIARPTDPFDVVHKINKVKITATTFADVEYAFKTSFTVGETDPFLTDGLILRINNISGSNITALTTRAGITTISSLRIEILA